jgi:hypothetical protein
MARPVSTYPSFQQVSKSSFQPISTPQQTVEVPPEMASVFEQLFKNDQSLVDAIYKMSQDTKISFSTIQDDFHKLIQELNRTRTELQVVAAEVRGHNSATPSVLPSINTVLPQQGRSDIYQSVFNP